MIEWAKKLIGLPDLYAKPDLGKRSPGWSKVRATHLKYEPTCQVCGTRSDVDVHHVQPFHIFHELELVESNLISLCTPHHFTYGHLCRWVSWNPSCRFDCEIWRLKIKNRPVPVNHPSLSLGA